MANVSRGTQEAKVESISNDQLNVTHMILFLNFQSEFILWVCVFECVKMGMWYFIFKVYSFCSVHNAQYQYVLGNLALRCLWLVKYAIGFRSEHNGCMILKRMIYFNGITFIYFMCVVKPMQPNGCSLSDSPNHRLASVETAGKKSVPWDILINLPF